MNKDPLTRAFRELSSVLGELDAFANDDYSRRALVRDASSEILRLRRENAELRKERAGAKVGEATQ